MSNQARKWQYCWLHIPTGNTGQGYTTEITAHEFLSLLAYWNTDEGWIYWPGLSSNLLGLVPRHRIQEYVQQFTEYV